VVVPEVGQDRPANACAMRFKPSVRLHAFRTHVLRFGLSKFVPADSGTVTVRAKEEEDLT
jgi:hypothetical protein